MSVVLTRGGKLLLGELARRGAINCKDPQRLIVSEIEKNSFKFQIKLRCDSRLLIGLEIQHPICVTI